MITKVELGDGTALENVEEVQEIIQNEGDSILYGLVINITKDAEGALAEISDIGDIFSRSGVLNSITVFKKDIADSYIDETTGEEVRTYGEEYVALSTARYTGVKSIYKHTEGNRISVHLTIDPTKLSDGKYNTLLSENARLEQTILEMSMLLGGAM